MDQNSGLRTLQHDLTLDRGITFTAACARLEHERAADDASGYRISRRPMFGRSMVILALQKPGKEKDHTAVEARTLL